jgi:hypothetical protein
MTESAYLAARHAALNCQTGDEIFGKSLLGVPERISPPSDRRRMACGQPTRALSGRLEQDVGVSWARYEGRALGDTALAEGALLAQLEDFIRAQNPNLTDVRLDLVTAAEESDTAAQPSRRWYEVTYLADNGEGY